MPKVINDIRNSVLSENKWDIAYWANYWESEDLQPYQNNETQHMCSFWDTVFNPLVPDVH